MPPLVAAVSWDSRLSVVFWGEYLGNGGTQVHGHVGVLCYETNV